MLFSRTHNIRPRSLRESVTLVIRISATDEHGMQSLSDGETLADVPASVRMLSGYAKMEYYQSAEIEAYEVQMRFVPYKFNELIWRRQRLSVDSIEDEGMRGRWLRVRCSRRDVI